MFFFLVLIITKSLCFLFFSPLLSLLAICKQTELCWTQSTFPAQCSRGSKGRQGQGNSVYVVLWLMHNSWASLWHYLVTFTDIHWGPRYPVFSFNWTKQWWQQASLNHTFKIQSPVFYISMNLTCVVRLGLIGSGCLYFPHSQNRLLLHAPSGYHNNKFGLKFNFQPSSQNSKNIWQHCCCVFFGGELSKMSVSIRQQIISVHSFIVDTKVWPRTSWETVLMLIDWIHKL